MSSITSKRLSAKVTYSFGVVLTAAISWLIYNQFRSKKEWYKTLDINPYFINKTRLLSLMTGYWRLNKKDCYPIKDIASLCCIYYEIKIPVEFPNYPPDRYEIYSTDTQDYIFEQMKLVKYRQGQYIKSKSSVLKITVIQNLIIGTECGIDCRGTLILNVGGTLQLKQGSSIFSNGGNIYIKCKKLDISSNANISTDPYSLLTRGASGIMCNKGNIYIETDDIEISIWATIDGGSVIMKYDGREIDYLDAITLW